MQPAQYWKPGEEKPRAGEGESKPASASKDHHPLNSSNASSGRSHRTRTADETTKQDKKGAGDSTRRHQGSSGGDPNKQGKKPKKGRYSSVQVEESTSSSGGKPVVAAGPSQGLLAMKVGEAGHNLYVLHSQLSAQRVRWLSVVCTW